MINRVKEGFDFSILEELDYEYSIMEAGYVSPDGATIVIESRAPHQGKVVQFSRHKEEEHNKNVEVLKTKGYLSE